MNKFCIDCHYFTSSSTGDWTRFRCMAPQNKAPTPNPVTGKQAYYAEFCIDVRKAGDRCGAEGLWFEKRKLPSVDELHEQVRAHSLVTLPKHMPQSIATNLLSQLVNLPKK